MPKTHTKIEQVELGWMLGGSRQWKTVIVPLDADALEEVVEYATDQHGAAMPPEQTPFVLRISCVANVPDECPIEGGSDA